MKVGILGGDMRQLSAAREFAANGYETAVYGFSPEYFSDSFQLCSEEYGLATRCDDIKCSVKGADIILLPLPYSSSGTHLNCRYYPAPPKLETVFNELLNNQNAYIFGGMLDRAAEEFMKNSSIKIYDYYKFEEICVKNAVLTAEGALEIALHELKISMYGAKTLIIGYGRIGKYLAHILKSLGADVTVSARKESDLLWISALGYTAEKTEQLGISKKSCNYDIIFNTVPAVIIDNSSIRNFSKETIYIELASSPGGICREAAAEYGLKVIPAPSLPGRCAPHTAGKIIKEAIENFIFSDTQA